MSGLRYSEQLQLMFKLILPFFFVLAQIANSSSPYDSYEQELSKMLRNLQAQINGKSQIASKALQTGSLFGTSQTLASQVYSTALKDIRNQIPLVLGQSTIPYNLKTGNCTTLPTAEFNNMNSLNEKLQNSQKQLANKLNQLNSRSKCPQTEEINSQSALINQEINIIKSQAAQFCPSQASQPSNNASGNGSTTTANGTKGGNAASIVNGTNGTGSSNVTSGATGANQTNGSTGTIGAHGINGTNTGNTVNGTTAATGANTTKGASETSTTNLTGAGGKEANGSTDASGKNVAAGTNGGAVINPINKPTSFLNNLDNGLNNWIYGNINPQTYYAEVNKQLSDGAKLCPAQNPYLDINRNCMYCPLLYSVALKRCASCPSGSSLNKGIHQCDTSSGETIIKNSNPSGGTNFIGNQPASIPNLSICPSTTPYFDGSQCISCNLPNYFDYTNLVCLVCGDGLQFDVASKICKPLDNSVSPKYVKYNSNLAGNTQNYAGSPPQASSSLDACPNQSPFFNGISCISCTLPLFFNFTSKFCQACEFSYKFDPSTKHCIIDTSKIYYSNSLNGVSNYIGIPPLLANSADKIVLSCPSNTPFSNGKICIECVQPKFYNFQTNQCQKCSNDLVFNSTSKSCTTKQTSGTIQKNSNAENISNFMFAMPQYNDSLMTCDAAAPYFNGAACISCSLPSYFNFKTLHCESCPVGQLFNPQNRLCQFKDQKFISDLSNKNIYYNGNFQAYASTIKAKRQINSSISVCPQETPFYQTTANQCIKCPDDEPIFNIKYSKCMNCGNDSSFDQASRICIYNRRIGLTLGRTLMNTFGL